MELDFKKLDQLAYSDFNTSHDNVSADDTTKKELTEVRILQQQSNLNEYTLAKAKEVYQEYQKNIKLSGELQNQILKGVQQGEDMQQLFLMAVKAISLMTSNTVFFSNVCKELDKESYKSIIE